MVDMKNTVENVLNAEQKAKQIIHDAEKEARSVKVKAESEAEEIIGKAENEAVKIIKDIRIKAEEEAKSEKESIINKADNERSILNAEEKSIEKLAESLVPLILYRGLTK